MSKASKRPRHLKRRLDITAMREALADGKCWTCLGVVVSRDGSHYEISDGDVLVELDLMPGEQSITARMGAAGGGQGIGIWYIPPVGSEVAVIMPDGDFAFSPIIVGVLSSGSLPDGVAPGVTVIANTSKVLIHDGAGGTDQLVTKSAYEAHVHPTGTGPSGVANNAASSASYTQILEAK
jgi:hypothetical protein